MQLAAINHSIRFEANCRDILKGSPRIEKILQARYNILISKFIVSINPKNAVANKLTPISFPVTGTDMIVLALSHTKVFQYWLL